MNLQDDLMKKEAYYFSHDANARNDVKILKVRRQLGPEGYAIYFMLIEHLREQLNYKLPLNSIPDLAYDFDVSEEKVKAVIMSYDLFVIEEESFFSARLIRSMEDYNSHKNKLIEAGRKGGLSKAKAMLKRPSSIKLNKIKGKESKEIQTAAQLSAPVFYEKELEANKNEKYFIQYKALVNFILGTESGIPLENVLSLPKQISYKKYLTLRATYDNYKLRSIKETLENMEAKKNLKVKYNDAFFVANVWLKNDFSKDKVA